MNPLSLKFSHFENISEIQNDENEKPPFEIYDLRIRILNFLRYLAQ